MTSLTVEREPAVTTFQECGAWNGEEQHRTEDFLATLGHEMRNPLNAIQYVLALLPIARDDPAKLEELYKILQRQLRHLKRLSDDLLDVAGIAHGKLNLRREEISLGELINGALEQVRPLIERCGHAVSVQLPAAPVVVYGDPSRLLQVFANLIQNAAKFMPAHGKLCITVESENGMAMVRVRDNGPGIEAHMLESIFEAYAQVNSAPTSANDGLGIGLRHVKSIVELHGGDVTALSNGLGQGSEFTVRLPILAARSDWRRVDQPACRRRAAGT
jgi:signal transduction histidine kinase